MSIGKSNLSEILINNTNIKTKRSVKYLGITIDDKLKFYQHIKQIEKKIEILIFRINKMCWLNKKLTLKLKMKMYKNLFMPIVKYGHKIWFNEIKNKVTYVNILIKTQRKILRIITGAYQSTNSEKLLELTDTINIIQEINTNKQNHQNTNKVTTKEMSIEKREKYFNFGDNFDKMKLKDKRSIWCLTGTGPFKEFLFLIKKADDNICRF